MSAKPSLEELRREIDEIDDAIHDLVMRRTQVVEQIGDTKARDRQAMRPAREAVILRRLVARHTGPFPIVALVRMWREMITALTRQQGPFAVAVYAPEDRPGFWDLARDHYGSAVPITAVNSPAAAVRAVSEGAATVALVPFPEEDDPDAWWPFLMSADPKMPRIVARLPFCGRGNARGDNLEALALAPLPHEPTGDDHTLLGVELVRDVSRGRLKDALEAAGLPPISFRSWLGRGSAETSLHMVEIADYVDVRDQRLTRLIGTLGDAVSRLTTLGGYAVPLASTGERPKR